MLSAKAPDSREREFFIDNLLVRIHFIIVMIRWAGLAPWEFESPFPGSLTSTFLEATSLRIAVSPQSTPLSSEHGTYEAVTARFWPWLEPFFRCKSLKRFMLFPSRSPAGPAGAWLLLNGHRESSLLTTYWFQSTLSS